MNNSEKIKKDYYSDGNNTPETVSRHKQHNEGKERKK